MRGSIRIFAGLIVAAGVAGGLDNATDAQLLPLALIGAAALFSMYSGARAANGLGR